jgi:hypothetical protein
MTDTGIDDVKKQRNAEYAKQYRMKGKLLMQQQESTTSEPQLAEKHNPQLLNHNWLKSTYYCYTYHFYAY